MKPEKNSPSKLDQQIGSQKSYSKVIRHHSSAKLADVIKNITSEADNFKNTEWKYAYTKMQTLFQLADKSSSSVYNNAEITEEEKQRKLEILCEFLAVELSDFAHDISYGKRNGSQLYNFMLEAIHILFQINTRSPPRIVGEYSFFNFTYRRQRSSTEEEVTASKNQRGSKRAAFHYHFGDDYLSYLKDVAAISQDLGYKELDYKNDPTTMTYIKV